MAVLQEFKCPCCDGGIEFDSNSQKMKCPFCDNEFEVETLMSYQKSLDDQGQFAIGYYHQRQDFFTKKDAE